MSDLPVIVIRFVLYADLMTLAGLVAFSSYAMTPAERSGGWFALRSVALGLSGTGLLFAILQMPVTVAAMTGDNLLSVDPATVREVVSTTAIGTAWVTRVFALLVAMVFAVLLDRLPRLARWGLLGASSVAIVTLVWTGHAGATEGSFGDLHRVSDSIHMLAAAVWVGGIAAFAMLLFHPLAEHPDTDLALAHRALDQFATVGTICVLLLVGTGILNGIIIAGLPPLDQLTGSIYARLLAIKLALFGAMLALAATNRWRLTPALRAGAETGNVVQALKALRRSLVAEGGAALAILALVAWLGTLEPPGAMV